jgi:transcriptional regulator GlxA family with amidase domain
MTREIGIVLFDQVEELDAVGPWEVFAAWCRFFPDDGFAVSTLSPHGGEVACAKGMTIVAQHAFADAPSYDLLLHPGGQGTRPLMKDEGHLAWVREQRAAVPLMTSVCTGSLVYAAAGLLADRPATTHWGSLELLVETDPSIAVRPDDRYVDDGDVITSAGVSAGIDMALHIVRRLVGEERAREVRRYIQYDPEPPV